MSTRPPSDEDLVAAWRDSGEPEILDELICRHVGEVRAMIYPMVLNDADADDLTQEVFVRALRGIAGFRGHAQFSTWLYRIAMNTARSFLAQRGRVQPSSPELLAQQADQRTTAPDESAIAGELDSQIEAAINTLSPGLRSAIVLTTLQGFGVREAAQIESCTTATMYWRIHKARTILKRRLAVYLK